MLSPPRLHPSVLRTPEHHALAGRLLTDLVEQRNQQVAELPDIAADQPSVSIAISTISALLNFDSWINIRFRNGRPNGTPCTWNGAGQVGNPAPCLQLDSGSTALVVPDFACIQALPGFEQNYKILAKNVCEPFKCPAHILRGPIEIPTPSGILQIPDCVFYACIADNKAGDRTANFGLGWIPGWWQTGVPAIPVIKAPFAYTGYQALEIDYAPAPAVLTAADQLKASGGSYLTLHKAMPPVYKTTFQLVRDPDCYWMALRPLGLGIGGTKTAWPRDPFKSIAMIDTGGGPVFLSDPYDDLDNRQWPHPVKPAPFGEADGSVSCEAVDDSISIEIGTATDGKFAYTVDTSKLPQGVQGLTLVACHECSYMRGRQGMNIGGISALFIKIIIDYSRGVIAFQNKQNLSA